ncbi:MAG TPA: glycerol-3-phosphate 1-O-acyltransferase PlsY [Stellaceae bacterium]|nr:glycerol-3-phosphate 1-O-acyltransferase PlsY [Stellaceae bacterium]
MTGFVAAAVIGYLLGSIPFGLVLTRLAGHGDVRSIGSGNIGATNVLRTGNKALAALTLALDLAKGSAAVAVAALWGHEAALVGAGAAVLGHMFPVWLGFRGGKGAATGLGVLLVLAWPVALIALAVWLTIVIVVRYSSLAALVAAAVAVIFAGLLTDRGTALLVVAVVLLIVARHHENIRRLLAGTESRVTLRKGRSV